MTNEKYRPKKIKKQDKGICRKRNLDNPCMSMKTRPTSLQGELQLKDAKWSDFGPSALGGTRIQLVPANYDSGMTSLVWNLQQAQSFLNCLNTQNEYY